MSQEELIAKDPQILDGTPVIKGTRIPVSLLKKLLKVGYSPKVINYEYPSLTVKKIIAFQQLVQNGQYVPASK